MSKATYREAVLGALKDKDPTNSHKLHSSDFSRAIERIGLDMNSPLVEEIMVQCNIVHGGMIDFSSYEDIVYNERSASISAQEKSSHNAGASALQAVRRGAKAEVIDHYAISPQEQHKSTASNEAQERIVRLKSQEVASLFQEFATAKMNLDEFKRHLETLGIHPTHDLDLLLRHSNGEVSFAELIKALTKPSNVSSDADEDSEQFRPPIRSTIRANTISTEEVDVHQSRRTNATKNATTFVRSSMQEEDDEQLHPVTKMRQSNTFYQDSSALVNAMSEADGSDGPMRSETRSASASGVGLPGQSVNTCEQKMIRKQVYAAIRKLDEGQLTAQQFQEKLFSMGVQIPFDIIRMLGSYESSGNVNFREFVRAFERYFESGAADTTISKEETEELLENMREQIKGRGSTSFQSLSRLFRIMDDDNDKKLSFGEFHKGVHDIGLIMNDEQIRALFNSFDNNGDGMVDCDEFMKKIRGTISGRRLALVIQAFHIMDKTGDGVVNAHDLQGTYDPTKHPDVKAGKKRPEDVLEEFLSTFDVTEKDGQVSEQEFVEYYSNISANIDDDAYFEQMMRSSWNLGASPPPAVSYSKKIRGTNEVPLAANHHGDVLSWSTSASALEERQDAKKHKTHRANNEESGHAITEWTTDSASKSSRGGTDRNQSSNILEWDVKSQAKDQKIRQDQIAAAVARESKGIVEVEKVRAASDLQKKYEMRARPYGVDESEEASLPSTQAMSRSKSGAQHETVRSGKNPVPLSQLVKH